MFYHDGSERVSYFSFHNAAEFAYVWLWCAVEISLRTSVMLDTCNARQSFS